MPLNKQIYLYSVGTDSFYTEAECEIHKKLQALYIKRKTVREKKDKVRLSAVNRVIRRYKKRLVALFDEYSLTSTPRELRLSDFCARNVVGSFDSALVRALGLRIGEVTKDLIIVNVFFFQVFRDLVLNGFYADGEKYVFLTASAGQIRNKKSVFIKDSRYHEIKDKLMCGLSWESINAKGGVNPNKFLAYLALSNSATDNWDSFDINKAIVVDDFESLVPGEVDYINPETYEIKRQRMEVPITHTDGCGMVLEEKTKMVRLPWIKGLMVNFPYNKFIREYRIAFCDDNIGIVQDIYGKKHDIIAEGIRYIFTRSQFKMWKYYSSWEEYKEKFIEFGCEACYCNEEEDKPSLAYINYQMLQTLQSLTDEEVKKIVASSNYEIGKIGYDYRTTLRLLGGDESNLEKNYFQEALSIYPELLGDEYGRRVIKETKKALVARAKAGHLRVNGQYIFLSPDLYAFCEFLFLKRKNPAGLLEDGEVYTRRYARGSDIACLRSPHLYKEWGIRRNKNDELCEEWFSHTNCLFTSCHDLISKILQFDNDGDMSLVVKDSTLINAAKREMKDVVPLYYEMKKAVGGQLSFESLYAGMVCAFSSGNIGPKSNLITVVYNQGDASKESLDVIKWLTMETNFTIDYAKTLYMPLRPDFVKKIIKGKTCKKVPYFFRYAKNKLDAQVEDANQSAMNRISAAVSKSKISWRYLVRKFDYHMLMDHTIPVEWVDVECRDIYEWYNVRQNLFFNLDEEFQKGASQELYVYRYLRSEIERKIAGKCSINYFVNAVVYYLYTERKCSKKKLLWNAFGDIVVNNLKNNTKHLGAICPICGNRCDVNTGLCEYHGIKGEKMK